MIKKDEMRVSITSNAKSMFYEFKKKTEYTMILNTF